mmetsp:Transcript_58060/g.166520  ORF Transcript_58060/g.166520 Transcript_58060/m.166520 type:complete len:215 (+) Transcript_58060:146-790(+)
MPLSWATWWPQHRSTCGSGPQFSKVCTRCCSHTSCSSPRLTQASCRRPRRGWSPWRSRRLLPSRPCCWASPSCPGARPRWPRRPRVAGSGRGSSSCGAGAGSERAAARHQSWRRVGAGQLRRRRSDVCGRPKLWHSLQSMEPAGKTSEANEALRGCCGRQQPIIWGAPGASAPPPPPRPPPPHKKRSRPRSLFVSRRPCLPQASSSAPLVSGHR